MAINSFWNNSAVEPKRQFRWVFSLANHFGSGWMIKSVTKPTTTVGVQEHKFFGHTYKYPGNVTWNDIDVTLVDPVSPDSANSLASILYNSGYNPPPNGNQSNFKTISKQKSTQTLGDVFIRQLDANASIIEQWKLTNPIVKNIDFGGTLSYDNEGLIELKITLAYDWAQLNTTNQGSSVGTGGKISNRYWSDGSSS